MLMVSKVGEFQREYNEAKTILLHQQLLLFNYDYNQYWKPTWHINMSQAINPCFGI